MAQQSQYIDQVTPFMDRVVARDIQYLERNFELYFSDEDLRCSPEDFVKICKVEQVPVRTERIDEEEFDRWFLDVDYSKSYPDYWKTYPSDKLVRKKALEHFISIDLDDFRPGDVVLDAGGATSPFCSICQDRLGASQVYHLDLPREDLKIEPGVHGRYIGASAAEIPLQPDSVDHVVSHNAIEHFEQGAYRGFLNEALRILRPGGLLCVLPLFVANRTCVYSSLNAWYLGKRKPVFEKGTTIVMREEIQQPYARFISAADLRMEFIDPVSEQMDCHVVFFENFREVESGFPFALVGRKR